jgi:hypothetical protein
VATRKTVIFPLQAANLMVAIGCHCAP